MLKFYFSSVIYYDLFIYFSTTSTCERPVDPVIYLRVYFSPYQLFLYFLPLIFINYNYLRLYFITSPFA